MTAHTIQLDGHDIALSNPDKVLYPHDDITKGDVVDYYRAVAEVMLPHLADRPLNLFRCPDGITSGFFQQRADPHLPDWITTVEVPARGDEQPVRHVVCDDAATLVHLANLASLELHRWLSTAATPSHPDLVVVDLDPPDGAPVNALRDAAAVVRDAFDDLDLVPFLQTTGGRGFHVAAPLDATTDEDAVRPAIRAMADRLAEQHPAKLTTQQRKSGRGDRIFLDTNRNAYGQTAITPYSLRARPGAPVATPIDWSELSKTTPDKYTLHNLPRRLAQKADPWRDIRQHARPADTLIERSRR
jgi:bifunctional non-homologous end joining protein LigD